MLVGHYAVAFAAKRIDSRLSLGTALCAAIFADVLWAVLVLAGLTQPAIGHNLTTMLLVAALLGAAQFAVTRLAGAAALVAGAALSHWLLDAPWLPSMLVLEGALWVLAVAAYMLASRSLNSAGRYAFMGGIAGLTFAWYNQIAGSPSPDPVEAAQASLIFFVITIGWAFWMDRSRAARS